MSPMPTTKEEVMPNGRWRLCTEVDSENFVSTVELDWNSPLNQVAARMFGHGDPSQRYETLVKLDGEWLNSTLVSSATTDEARIQHGLAVAKWLPKE